MDHIAPRLIERIRELSSPMAPRATATASTSEPLRGIRAVLFDVYGTLLMSGSGDVGVAAARDDVGMLTASLEAVGLHPEPEAGARGLELFRDTVLKSHAQSRRRGIDHPEVDIVEIWSHVLKTLRSRGLIRGESSEAVLYGVAIEYETRTNPVWPMPGCLALLATLRERPGTVLGIVSNAQFYTPLTLHALLGASTGELGIAPDLCAWSYRLGRAKPSVRMFDPVLTGLKSRGISPEEAVYVGNDMLNDVWTANRAGLRTVLFAGDARSLRLREDDWRCRSVAPTAVIQRLDQLPGLLAG